MNVKYHFKSKHASILINSFDNLYVKNKTIGYILIYYHDFDLARKVLKNPKELINVMLSKHEFETQIKWKPNKNDLEIIKQQPEYSEFKGYFIEREWMLCRVIGVCLKLDQFEQFPRDLTSETLLEMLRSVAPNDVIMPELSTKFERMTTSSCSCINLKKINHDVLNFLIKHHRVNIKNFTENGKIKTLRFMTTDDDVFENIKLEKHILIVLSESNLSE